MKNLRLVSAALITAACIGLALAQSPSATSPTTAGDDVERIRKLGQELGDAMVASDFATIDRLYADDWVTVGTKGDLIRKETMMENFKSGKHRLQSFELGPIDVQVVGNVAVAHGGVTEKRVWDGKDTSGEFLYMDLLEKRGKDWVITRSAGKRVK